MIELNLMRLLLPLLLLLFSLPAFCQEIIDIEKLTVNENFFDDLEEAKKNPEQVFYLDLSMQKLQKFPEEIFTFKNLKELLLPYNYWNTIPDRFAELEQLELLDLSGNYYLNKLPPSIAKLKNLRKLILRDHKFSRGEIEKIEFQLKNVLIESNPHKG